MSRKQRIGVIGAGRIGKIHIENLMKNIPNAELKIVVDVDLTDELRDWISNLGISKLSTDAKEIFLDNEIDAVVIASSTNTHSTYIREAARSKKHIFCEKPIDVDINQIETTLSIVKEENVRLMIGFNRRFDRNFKKVQEMVNSGEIGTPHIIKITSRDPAPPSMEYIKNSGGIFVDMSIHDWDMAYYLAGSDIEEVYARGEVLVDPNFSLAGDIDTAVAILKFKNNALGIVDNSRKAVYGYDQRVEVFGSKGCVIADNESENTIRLYTSKNIQTNNIPYFFLERYRASYAAELQYFFECLNYKQEPKPNGEDGLKSVLVAHAAQKSFKENRPVKISEIKP